MSDALYRVESTDGVSLGSEPYQTNVLPASFLYEALKPPSDEKKVARPLLPAFSTTLVVDSILIYGSVVTEADTVRRSPQKLQSWPLRGHTLMKNAPKGMFLVLSSGGSQNQIKNDF